MDVTFTTLGAVIGLVIAIVLIIKKVNPAYSLILGALIGGLIGGGGLEGTVTTMVNGAGSMMSSVLRILTSGILAGALIKTGSAQKIAETIVDKLGERRAVAAIAIATMIICAVGVFIDISVITVAPIALAIGERAGLSKSGVLIAMIGGGKAGNIISPNPNTIAVAEAFKQDLTAVMMRNIIPAICALIVTILIASVLTKRKGDPITASDLEETNDAALPSFPAAFAGPLVVILLLALRPIAGITIDPLIALPVGGIVCVLVTGHTKELIACTEFGLSKVIGVAILLIGTGTIAGIIKARPDRRYPHGRSDSLHDSGRNSRRADILRNSAQRRCPGTVRSSHDSRRRNGCRLSAARLILPRDRRRRLHEHQGENEADPVRGHGRTDIDGRISHHISDRRINKSRCGYCI